MKKTIIITTVSIVSIIVLTELGLRNFYFEQLKKRQFPLIYQSDSLYGYTLIPNATVKLVCPSQNNTFQLNNHGFIGNDFDVNKPDSVFRIIHIGTSAEANYGIKNKANYNYKIQDIFDSLGYNAEFLNLSIDGGARSLFNFNLIKDKYLDYNPNIILFTNTLPLEAFYYSREKYKNYIITYAVGNENSRKRARKIIDDIEKKKAWTFIYDNSFIVRAICKKYIEKAPFNVDGNDFTVFFKTYMENSVKMGGYHCIFVRQSPTKTALEFKELQSKLRSDQQLISINYLDIEKNSYHVQQQQLFSKISGIKTIQIDIKQEDYTKLLTYKHDGHPSEFMQAIMAEKIFMELDSIIPEKYKK